MSTTATNGYTIRLELLKMAKEMLEQDWHAGREMLTRQWEQEVNLLQNKYAARDLQAESQRDTAFRAFPTAADVVAANVTPICIPPLPIFRPFPTEEEIIKKATALNNFISAK